MTTMQDVAGFVSTADEDDLTNITEMVAARRKALARIRKDSLSVGDVVRFNDRTSPKYLVGVRANVVRITRDTVHVTIADTVGRFHAGSPITCPPSMLDAVK